MTLREAALAAYAWCVAHNQAVLAVGVGVPIVGTLLAWIGRGGRTDRDGRKIASVVVGLGMFSILLLVVGVAVGQGLLGGRLGDADLLLVAAPVVCFAGTMIGIHWVFPLNQLATVRTAVDVGFFVLACLAAIWFLSKFHGWGLYFFGSVTQLLVIGVLAFYFIRRLYRRAFLGS
jgi:hypothetical protein